MGEVGQMIPHPKHIQSHILSAALFFDSAPQKMMLQHQLCTVHPTTWGTHASGVEQYAMHTACVDDMLSKESKKWHKKVK